MLYEFLIPLLLPFSTLIFSMVFLSKFSTYFCRWHVTGIDYHTVRGLPAKVCAFCFSKIVYAVLFN